jgi:hypothetical protein
MPERKSDLEPPHDGALNKLTFLDLDNLRDDVKKETKAAHWYGILKGVGVAAVAGGAALSVHGGFTHDDTEMRVGLVMDVVGVTSVALGGFRSIRHDNQAYKLNNALVRLVDRSQLDPFALQTGLQEATELGLMADPERTMNFVIAATQLEDLLAAKGVDLGKLQELAPTERDSTDVTPQPPQLPIVGSRSPQEPTIE